MKEHKTVIVCSSIIKAEEHWEEGREFRSRAWLGSNRGSAPASLWVTLSKLVNSLSSPFPHILTSFYLS